MFSKYSLPKQKIIIFLIVVLIIGFVGGLATGFWARPACDLVKTACGDYNEGWKAARQKLSNDNGLPGMVGPSDSLAGTAKIINGDRIVFTAPLVNPLDSEDLRERTALITDQTEIVLHRAKTEEDLAAEAEFRAEELRKIENQLAAFDNGRELIAAGKQINELNGQIKDLRDKTSALLQDPEISSLWMQMHAMEAFQPTPFAYKEMGGKISDIKPGLSVLVIAGGDIRESREFTAKKIIVSENSNNNTNMPAVMPTEAGNTGGLDTSPYNK